MNNQNPDNQHRVDAAWKAMELLLDQELPVEQDSYPVFPFWTKVSASVLFLLALGYWTAGPFQNPAGPVAGGIALPKNDGSPGYRKMVDASRPRGILKEPRQVASPRVVATEGPVVAEEEEEAVQDIAEKAWKQGVADNVLKEEGAEIKEVKNVLPKDSSLLAAVSKKKPTPQPLSVSVGVGANCPSSLRSLYPVASLRVPLGKRSGVSVGVAMNAAVDIEGVRPREVLFLNDQARDIQFEVTQTIIRKAYYVDLPVEFSWRIGNQLSVSTGMQISLLQHSLREEEKSNYGFAADPSMVVASVFRAGSVQSAQSYAEALHQNKTDYRALLGLTYQWQRASLQVKYQHGLRDVFRVKDFEGRLSGRKNQLVSLGIAYRLWQGS